MSSSNNALISFGSRPNAHHFITLRSDATDMMSGLPWILRFLIRPLGSTIQNFLLSDDKDFTVEVADEALSGSEAFNLMKMVGTHIDEFVKLELGRYFQEEKRVFTKKISGVGQLKEFVDDIVLFCTYLQNGSINKVAIRSVLTTLLKTEMREERETIDKSERCVLFDKGNEEYGVLVLHFSGSQIQTQTCCTNAADTTIKVHKRGIMFRNTQDLLLTLRAFAHDVKERERKR